MLNKIRKGAKIMKRDVVVFLGIVVVVLLIVSALHFMQVPPQEFVYQLF